MTNEEREAAFRKDLYDVLVRHNVELSFGEDFYGDHSIDAFFNNKECPQWCFTVDLGNTLNAQERPTSHSFQNIEKIKYEFITRYNGHMQAFYNPNNRLIADLPTIYGYTAERKGSSLVGRLVAQDGTIFASQICDDESHMLISFGIISNANENHKMFKEHYPDGYKMELVLEKETPTHAGLNAVFARQLYRKDP